MMRAILAYLAAVLVTYAVAVVFASQSVAGHLADMGVRVGAGERLGMVVHDLAGMVGIFLPVIAIGLLVALLVSTWLIRLKPAWRTVLYCLAGATAVISVHIALKLSFDITPVAVARSIPGLISQAIAGAVGGYVFARLKPVRSKPLSG